MQIKGVKVRYINSQCYEFILPNGKHLITDPYMFNKGLEIMEARWLFDMTEDRIEAILF